MTVTHLTLFYLFVVHQSAPPALDDSIALKIRFWTTAFSIKALVDEALPVLNDSMFLERQRLTDSAWRSTVYLHGICVSACYLCTRSPF